MTKNSGFLVANILGFPSNRLLKKPSFVLSILVVLGLLSSPAMAEKKKPAQSANLAAAKGNTAFAQLQQRVNGVQGKATGSILFMGRYATPGKKPDWNSQNRLPAVNCTGILGV